MQVKASVLCYFSTSFGDRSIGYKKKVTPMKKLLELFFELTDPVTSDKSVRKAKRQNKRVFYRVGEHYKLIVS